MKKILLGAAIILASTTAAQAAQAPKVTLGGRIDTHYGVVNQKDIFDHLNPVAPTAANKRRTHSLVNDTKIDVNVDGVMNNGTKYGGLIRLHADTSTATNDESGNADKTMVYLESNKFGRIEAGNYPGAGAQLEMDIDNLGVGTYGVNGFWSQWPSDKTRRISSIESSLGATNISDTAGFEFIVSPSLPSNYSGHFYSDAPKVSFFTQPIPQITLGISYIPDLDSTGTISGVAPKSQSPVFDADRMRNPASFKDVWSGGIRAETAVKKVNVKATLTGEVGQSKLEELRDLRAMEGGLQLGYENIKLVGTAGTAFKSWTLRERVAGTKQGGFYWTLGASHQIDKLGYSVGYLNSRKAGGMESAAVKAGGLILASNALSDVDYNKFQLLTLDVDYQVAPGLLAFVGVAGFDFDEKQALQSNKGTVTLIGTRLVF